MCEMYKTDFHIQTTLIKQLFGKYHFFQEIVLNFKYLQKSQFFE